jgi:hypothetical protein
MGVVEGTPQDMRVHIRGNYLTLGDEVPRRFPRVVATSGEPVRDSESGRLQFARWLTSPAHPLTARVIANRVWLWHFGQGLVRTPDNFGRLGERPTHPELLDWLALRLIEDGWSIKRLSRLIMTSATYCMSTQFDGRSAEVDPRNRMWWRFERTRLDAEQIRDSILALSDDLDLRMGGQLMKDKNRAYVTGTGSKKSTYAFNQRSVYLPILRSAVYDVFQAFDFGDPSVIQGQRAATTVAPQALFMMNGELVQQQSRRLAQNIVRRRSTETDRAQEVYRSILGRDPSPAEEQRAIEFARSYAAAWPRPGHHADEVGQRQVDDRGDTSEEQEPLEVRAWQGLCRVLLASNEFLYLD